MSGAQDPILVWGAGAIGGTLGAAFVRAGEPVVFVDAARDHVAAMREGGLEITGADLLPWSRWVTPEQVPMRFDTRFYVGLAPPHAKPEPDGVEMADARWVEPATALADFADGTFELSFPTVKHLEELRGHANADSVMSEAAGRPVVPLTPKIVSTEDGLL